MIAQDIHVKINKVSTYVYLSSNIITITNHNMYVSILIFNELSYFFVSLANFHLDILTLI